jgi:hypothetical protein
MYSFLKFHSLMRYNYTLTNFQQKITFKHILKRACQYVHTCRGRNYVQAWEASTPNFYPNNYKKYMNIHPPPPPLPPQFPFFLYYLLKLFNLLYIFVTLDPLNSNSILIRMHCICLDGGK